MAETEGGQGRPGGREGRGGGSIRAASRRLWPYLRAHGRAYGLGGLALLVTNLFLVSIPYLFSRMVELLDARPVDLSRMFHLFLLVLAAALGAGAARVASRLLIFNTGRAIEYELRRTLFAHMQRMTSSVFARRRTGDLVSRATNDLNSVRLMFGFGLLNLLNTPILFVMAVAVMARINPRLTPAVLAIYPVVILGVRGYSRRMFDLTQQVQGTLGEISAAAQESFSAVQVVKSYTLEDHEMERFRRLSRRYLGQSVRLALTRNVLFNVMTAVIGLSELVLLGFGGWEIVHGRLTKGELVAFNVYLGMMVWPTMAFGFLLSVWQRGMGAMSRIEEILAEPTEPGGGDCRGGGTREEPRLRGRGVQVHELQWAYPGGEKGGETSRPALRGVSLELRAGRFTALVGPTGCGKSTLARLLTRLDDPPRGTIFVGGVDVTEIPLPILRRHVGLADQEAFLFSVSVEENIRFGRPEADHGEVVRAAEAAELARDLDGFPRGYETLVGERGITLSGGQRQRVTLARLLLYDPEVFILDDTLSAVDLKTERRVLSRLRECLGERTVLLITHRATTAREADYIYVMDRGEIVEEGTHEVLLAAGGLYRKLVEMQELDEGWERGQ